MIIEQSKLNLRSDTVLWDFTDWLMVWLKLKCVRIWGRILYFLQNLITGYLQRHTAENIYFWGQKLTEAKQTLKKKRDSEEIQLAWLKEILSKDESWPENIKNVQICSTVCSQWWFYQYLHNRYRYRYTSVLFTNEEQKKIGLLFLACSFLIKERKRLADDIVHFS